MHFEPSSLSISSDHAALVATHIYNVNISGSLPKSGFISSKIMVMKAHRKQDSDPISSPPPTLQYDVEEVKVVLISLGVYYISFFSFFGRLCSEILERWVILSFDG